MAALDTKDLPLSDPAAAHGRPEWFALAPAAAPHTPSIAPARPAVGDRHSSAVQAASTETQDRKSPLDHRFGAQLAAAAAASDQTEDISVVVLPPSILTACDVCFRLQTTVSDKLVNKIGYQRQATVERRYSHFAWLHRRLRTSTPLPPNTLTMPFDLMEVARLQKDLQTYIARLCGRERADKRQDCFHSTCRRQSHASAHSNQPTVFPHALDIHSIASKMHHLAKEAVSQFLQGGSVEQFDWLVSLDGPHVTGRPFEPPQSPASSLSADVSRPRVVYTGSSASTNVSTESDWTESRNPYYQSHRRSKQVEAWVCDTDSAAVELSSMALAAQHRRQAHTSNAASDKHRHSPRQQPQTTLAWTISPPSASHSARAAAAEDEALQSRAVRRSRYALPEGDPATASETAFWIPLAHPSERIEQQPQAKVPARLQQRSQERAAAPSVKTVPVRYPTSHELYQAIRSNPRVKAKRTKLPASGSAPASRSIAQSSEAQPAPNPHRSRIPVKTPTSSATTLSPRETHLSPRPVASAKDGTQEAHSSPLRDAATPASAPPALRLVTVDVEEWVTPISWTSLGEARFRVSATTTLPST
eukprot:m.98115 g.98115  ORF g.98115 m.98115 type:complete len:589 (+) comp8852_c0_seq2:24-1790(+)